MFIRVKKFGKLTYYYLVKNTRDGNKVHQKVIRYLGKEKPTPEDLKKIIREVEK